MDRQDLTIVRMLLISSNQNIVACVRETSFYCSHGQPRTTVLDASHYLIWSATDRRFHINSYGQPQTRGSSSTHMVSLQLRHEASTVRKTARVNHDEGQVPQDGQVPETTPRTSSSRRHRRVHGSRRLRRSLNLLIPELKYIGCAESQHKQTGFKPLSPDLILYKRQSALHQLQSFTVVVLSSSAEISAITSV